MIDSTLFMFALSPRANADEKRGITRSSCEISTSEKKRSCRLRSITIQGTGETLRVSQRICMFIAYELQFRDGSGLIQFNGAPGELYARRHLVA